jgi:hypothetical protein
MRKSLIEYMPNLYKDNLLGTMPKLSRRIEIFRVEIDKYLKSQSRKNAMTDSEYRDVYRKIFQQGMREQYYFFTTLYETINTYMIILEDETTQEYQNVLRQVREIFEKWKWELHLFYKYDYLPAKRAMKRLILRAIYDPQGFNNKSGMGFSWKIKDHIKKRLQTYLVVLLAEQIIFEFKQMNLEEYNRLGYERDGRDLHLTPNDEKEITEKVIWEVENYYDH